MAPSQTSVMKILFSCSILIASRYGTLMRLGTLTLTLLSPEPTTRSIREPWRTFCPGLIVTPLISCCNTASLAISGLKSVSPSTSLLLSRISTALRNERLTRLGISTSGAYVLFTSRNIVRPGFTVDPCTGCTSSISSPFLVGSKMESIFILKPCCSSSFTASVAFFPFRFGTVVASPCLVIILSDAKNAK
ncbi:hypothetical protein D9M68_777020 [compost metagenome]